MEKYIGEIVAALVALGAVLLVAYQAAKAALTTKVKALLAAGAAVAAALLVGLAERLS
jgi:hypothetical protein